jgi:pyruvate dehydrogenase E2 component (dihydrolipoamide acetyltransferase)
MKNITVPDVGAEHVDVIEVLVKVGDVIKVESPLLTLESDKATMDVPSSDAGVIKEVKVKVGDKVSQGTVIFVLEMTDTASATTKPAEESVAQKAEAPKQEAPKQEAQTQEEAPVSQPQEAQTGTVIPAGHNADVHAGPAVRKLAREFGVDLLQVAASGPKQRIMKEDVQQFVKSKLAAVPSVSGGALPAAPTIDFAKFGLVETQALSRIKKLSGKNLHRNWLLVPHITQFGDADITDLEEFRVSNKARFEKQGVKLTPLVFIMKAVASSLKTYPQFNASLDSTGENLILKKYVNIGVAVDTPDGLVVPVIRDVDKKGLLELAKELAIVSEKARNKQLTANDMQGGCFSISSLGGIGGTAFTPIVNLPEVAILGVSKSSYKPVYDDGVFVPRLMLPLSLSYDHRVIDGADGARFITSLSNALTDIRSLLL